MINVAMLLGRVGKKDNKSLRNGGEITVLSVATSRKYKDASGQTQEQTTRHNVSCFSKLAEIANKYVQVGDLVFVQGEIQNKKVENGDRAGQYIYSIHANEIKFIPKGNKSQGEPSQGKEKSQSKPQDRLPFDDNEIPFF